MALQDPCRSLFYIGGIMQLYINILDYRIPSYGLMIVIGVVLANLLALYVVRKFNQDINDFFLLEAYAFLGGFTGAKLLYIMVSPKQIEWNRITEFSYFNKIMQSGFVFYGGLILGLLFVIFAGKIHKLPTIAYMRNYIFLIPFIHGFGRLGCIFAGCCYGIPYDGIGAVVFPKVSLAPPGIPLFPVQIVEAICLMIISLTILMLQLRIGWKYTIETYFIAYGIIRFLLEYLRYDDERGSIYMFSTSQWISLLLIVVAFVMLLYQTRIVKKKLIVKCD